METLKIWKVFEESGFFARMRNRLKNSESKNPEPNLEDYSLEMFFQ